MTVVIVGFFFRGTCLKIRFVSGNESSIFYNGVVSESAFFLNLHFDEEMVSMCESKEVAGQTPHGSAFVHIGVHLSICSSLELKCFDLDHLKILYELEEIIFLFYS